MTLQEYFENFYFCLNRAQMFYTFDIEGDINIDIDEFCVTYSIPQIESVRKKGNIHYYSTYYYNLYFSKTINNCFEILCHLRTNKYSVDACIFIADFENGIVYKEWTDDEIPKSYSHYKSHADDHLEAFQQILTISLQSKEELIDYFEFED